jgi:hypothetical protein
MKNFGAVISALGGLLALLLSQGVYALGEQAETVDTATSEVLSGMGTIGTGVSVMILLFAGFAFMSSGRFAGMLLIVCSIFGFFTGAGFLMALPFFGGIMCMAGGGNRVAMGSNYTEA